VDINQYNSTRFHAPSREIAATSASALGREEPS